MTDAPALPAPSAPPAFFRRRYLAAMLGSLGAVLALVLMLNCLVDPCWYLRGNLLTGVNFAFNERIAKLNWLLPRLDAYDCIVMGTSRTTVLPAQAIEGHRCFNLAFSGARAAEFVTYARYLRDRGFHPSLLVVGVDEFDLMGKARTPRPPDFVVSGKNPPSLLASYLSMDALRFSLLTLANFAPNHRYYDSALNGQIVPRKHHYRPPKVTAVLEDATDIHPERAEAFVALRRIFPQARAIAYLPPVSAWQIAQLDHAGSLDALIKALVPVARAYDRFLDFRIPSPLTETIGNTDDGSHYSVAVNAQLAAALADNQPALGLDWHGREARDILALYHQRLDDFLTRRAESVLREGLTPTAERVAREGFFRSVERFPREGGI
jgi:hypothetical protein